MSGPLVYVSDLMSDPEFVQSLMLVRRSPCVDAYGKNTLAEKTFCVVGSVQPISGKTLQRIPEAFRVANVQSFWLKEKIITDGRDQYPDIIIKNGIRFAVQLVFDWSDWGAGWSEGTCVQERPAL